MSKIENEKTQVPSTKDMNDMDLLNDVLFSEKIMNNNYNTSLGEMSNKNLFKKFMELYEEMKNLEREAFDLIFKNGWYSLEKEEETKINQVYTEANSQTKELG